MIVNNPRRARPGGPGVDVTDFPDIPGCTAARWDGDNLAVEFDHDLTPAEQQTVIWRCESLNAVEEELRRRARVAYQGNVAYLASTPTQAQAIAQVAALTRQMQGVIRMLLQQLDTAD